MAGLAADTAGAAAAVSYAHHLTEGLSAFGEARAGYLWGREFYGQAVAGLLWEF